MKTNLTKCKHKVSDRDGLPKSNGNGRGAKFKRSAKQETQTRVRNILKRELTKNRI